VLTHNPQPMHLFKSKTAFLLSIERASISQRLTQVPQPLHVSVSRLATKGLETRLAGLG
jgi:hypothetical protein